MSATQPMPSTRRRPIPGMASQPIPDDAPSVPEVISSVPAEGHEQPESKARPRRNREASRKTQSAQRGGGDRVSVPDRRPAANYAATRLVNFRIPVDLHDRFRALVRESETRHPWLRKQSLT